MNLVIVWFAGFLVPYAVNLYLDTVALRDYVTHIDKVNRSFETEYCLPYKLLTLGILPVVVICAFWGAVSLENLKSHELVLVCAVLASCLMLFGLMAVDTLKCRVTFHEAGIRKVGLQGEKSLAWDQVETVRFRRGFRSIEFSGFNLEEPVKIKLSIHLIGMGFLIDFAKAKLGAKRFQAVEEVLQRIELSAS